MLHNGENNDLRGPADSDLQPSLLLAFDLQ